MNMPTQRPELAAIREYMVIDGQPYTDCIDRVPVYDPATGEVIAQQLEAGPKQVDDAVQAAKRAFESSAWRDMMPAERERLILALADRVQAEGDALSRLETLNNGKLLALSQGLEVGSGVQWLRYMAGWATKIGGETFNVSIPFPPDTKYHAYTTKEPVGVVAAIVPWNFPLLMAIWKIAPALATGCTIVLKPAEETPLTAIRLAELVQEVGFPPGVVNVITGRGHITGDALIKHPDINKITFTGSTEVGKLVGHAAVDGMKRMGLELGGKSPVVIMDDCSIEQSIQGAAAAIFFNQGQVCTAGSRLFVQEGIYDQVIEGMSEAAKSLKLGSGFEPDTQIGPMVSAKHRDRVVAYINAGIESGARMVAGGEVWNGPGYFVRPTIFADAPLDSSIVREEIFGPVLVAAKFKTEEEAIALANDTPYGLGASLWSNDVGRINRIVPRIKAGTVWVNTHNMLDPHMPFGGYKQSGIGREHGHAVIESYLEAKSVCMAYSAK